MPQLNLKDYLIIGYIDHWTTARSSALFCVGKEFFDLGRPSVSSLPDANPVNVRSQAGGLPLRERTNCKCRILREEA